jgi:hypothetical protein
MRAAGGSQRLAAEIAELWSASTGTPPSMSRNTDAVNGVEGS